jgi:hypothetical protein
MTPSLVARAVLGCVALTSLAATPQAQRPDSTLLRVTNVTVTITNDPAAAYNRTYSASGISTKCGLADYGYPHRTNSFAVMFPDDTGAKQVTSVNFDADTLRGGTTVTSFYLSVGIRVGQRGMPPAYVVRANQPQFAEPGTAQLVRLPNGADSLVVRGTATKGTKVAVEMTLFCQR